MEKRVLPGETPFRVSFDPEDLPSTLSLRTKCRIEGNPFRMNPAYEIAVNGFSG